MLAGMDVTHPSPGSIEGAPSIAGVVASIDGRYGQWPGIIRAQTSRKEMIEKLDEMFGGRLDLWRKHNQGGLPNRIIIYRDGVSEGQYRTLLQDELPRIQEACAARYLGGRMPKISIVVCGKRHHTRFFPTQEKDADYKKSMNPQNGTVVDRGVTMEKGWDFFLQAHHCLQGTARPTHYVVIHDKNDMDADKMEALVSIPTIHKHVFLLSVLHRRTISAICLAERPRQSLFAHRLTMRILSVNEAAPIFTRSTTLATARLSHLDKNLTGTDRHGSKESILRFRIQCTISKPPPLF